MGANDDALLPWLGPEKRFIRHAIDARKRVLGICLGAQLIAAVLGARVFPNEQKEIGWFTIRRSADAVKYPLGAVFPKQIEAFHWHGDTFDLPAGTIRLSSSDACLNQAFAYGDHVLALQFHLETTFEGTRGMIGECANELVPAPYVQTADEMLSRSERFDNVNRLMKTVLERLAE